MGVWGRVLVRWAACAALAAGFGAVDAFCYRIGVSGILLWWVANLAAAWLLLAFVCGWIVRSPWASAPAGLLGIQVALWVFYRQVDNNPSVVMRKWVLLGQSRQACGSQRRPVIRS